MSAEKEELYKHELGIAADIQTCMLPKKVPKIPGLDMSAFYQPCQYIGGDYYDFIEIDQEHLGVVVADVSGKGVPGALVMAQARTLMRAEAAHSPEPRDILIRINRFFAGEIPKGMFVTMFYALINLPKLTLTLCSAGHNPMLYWRQKMGRVGYVNTKGLALGIDKGKLFEKRIEEAKLQFEPGDSFLLYTDGLNEAMNSKGEEYGLARLSRLYQEFATRDCAEFLSTLSYSVARFTGEAPQHDDITALTMRRLIESEERKESRTIIDGERFKQCSFCEAVNPRDVARCQVCHEPLNPSFRGKVDLALKEGEVECSGCRRIFSRRQFPRGCPTCKRPMCAVCKMLTASVGAYCLACSKKR
jgi:sigma-B regulation protein RsbU (phosphoserine phosphatase)